MSQSALGEALDLTFQQIQKYERGANRIGASRLYAMAQVLGVPVSYFFEGMEENRAPSSGESRVTAMPRDPATKRETLELVRAYYKIDDPALRLSLVNTIKAIAAEEDAAADGK
jgi:transcriptional regulator with XRE-family HTH domain